jgi:hypothetical protein
MRGVTHQIRRLLVKIIGLLLISMFGITGGSTHGALADNWGNPMHFEFIPKRPWLSGDKSAILGDGDIVSNTAAVLEQFLIQNRIPPNTEIHLNSRGGDVSAGLKMGRLIRAHHLHTWVGMYDQRAHRSVRQMLESTVNIGYCISSCTLAFLGGVERQIDYADGIYAVHQVTMECVNPNLPEADQHTEVSTCLTVTSAMIGVQEILGEVIEYVNEMGVDPRFVEQMTKADPKDMNSLSIWFLREYKITK